MKEYLHLVALALITGFVISAKAEITYNVIDLGTLGGNSSQAWYISNNGQIVGWALDNAKKKKATLFDPSGGGRNINLGTLGGKESEAYCINDNGQIVGYANDTSGQKKPTIFDSSGQGNNINIGKQGEGEAHFVNNKGQIVGWEYFTKATLFDPTGNGQNIYLGSADLNSSNISFAYSVNEKGKIVGQEYVEGFAYLPTLFDASGDGDNIYLEINAVASVFPKCINENDEIVGGTRVSGAFYLDLSSGEYFISKTSSCAYSINDKGQIVGEIHNSNGEFRATLFDPTGNDNNIDLNTLIDPSSGWILEKAYSINNDGWIVGQGKNNSRNEHAFLLVPVPEPAILSLWSIGLTSFLIRWKRII